MINSRTKGASAEREFASLIYDQLGVKLERNLNQSRNGGHDLTVSGFCLYAQHLNQYAIEIKRYRQVTDAKINDWWAQTLTQAKDANLTPLLAFRQDRQAWRIVVPLTVLSNYLPNQYPEIQWTAWLSVEGFCEHVTKSINTRRFQVAKSLNNHPVTEIPLP